MSIEAGGQPEQSTTAATANTAEVAGRKFVRRDESSRVFRDKVFVFICLVTSAVSLLLLAVLLGSVLVQGLPHLNLAFLRNAPEPKPADAGIFPALAGTVWICSTCALMTLPLGVAAAIYLEEFRPTIRLARSLHSFVQLNIANLAGVPSVVYGIIGLTAFVSMFHLFGSIKTPSFEIGVDYYDQFVTEGDLVVLAPVAHRDAEPTRAVDKMQVVTPGGERVQIHAIAADASLPRERALRRRTLRADAESGRISRRHWYYLQLPLGRGVLAGSLTLMLVILPIVIIAAQEALRGVPDTLREAALGLGATRWQMVWTVTLPAATPGIMTGSILAMSRAIGEAAPFLIIAGIVYIGAGPGHLMDDFTVMPLQIYNWTARPQAAFHGIAATGIIVLLAILLSFNAAAVIVRQLTQKPLS